MTRLESNILQKFCSKKNREQHLTVVLAASLTLAEALFSQTCAAAVEPSASNQVQTCRNDHVVSISDDEELFFSQLSPCQKTSSGYSLTDEFERDDAATLGAQWLDCDAVKPDSFEPLGILDGGVVVSNPYSRPGVYDTTPPSGHPPTENRLYPGIGCAFVDTGSTTVSVKIIWSGHHGVNDDAPTSHVEATPLLYINKDSAKFGFGAWTSELYDTPVMLVGYVGSPVENFESLAYVNLTDGHTSGTPREIELRAEEPGKVTVWVDGQQVELKPEIGFAPFEVHPSLIDSTYHGFAVDAHLVDPPSNIPTIKSIEAISIKELN